ncbi:MAG: hypothetical protein H6841_07965 [Planctomycetes bacterium]|nr:hypothetical protein [Planctomycetota bacterium]MCB9935469.1 hypothetical protein [Planctomycetota bacterium]
MSEPMQDPGQPGALPPGGPQYQPPMPGPYPPMYPPPYPPPKKGMSGAVLALIIVGVVFGVVAVGGVLVGILAVAVIPKLTEAKNKLEVKQMADLQAGLQNLAVDQSKSRRLNMPPLREARGEQLWMLLLQEELIDQRLSKKLVSLNSRTDTPQAAPTQGGNHCSYTLPEARSLLTVMNKRGSERCVVVTFNSRNWNNYPEAGVPCIWSDNAVVSWLTFEDAQRDWGITADEWADPGGKLLGKKPPFQFTHE